jgi:hypothetical protein
MQKGTPVFVVAQNSAYPGTIKVRLEPDGSLNHYRWIESNCIEAK